MQKRWLVVSLAGIAAVMAATLLALYGCGGGGGPLRPPAPTAPPSPSAEFVALLPEGQRNATFVGTNRCAECHQGFHAKWQEGRHSQVDVGCERCHGPGSEHVKDPSENNILTYPNITRSVVCGQCHGQQFDEFRQSAHAKMVDELADNNFVSSNPRLYVAVCYRCHSAPFRMQLVDEPLSEGVSPDQIDAKINALSNDQLLAYLPVSHETATCATCHTAHSVKPRYARFNTDTAPIAPGTPPKLHTTFNHTCATCHNGRGANPSDYALQTGTARPNMHESNQFNMLMGIGGVESDSGGQDPSLPMSIRRMAHAEAPNQCVHCHMPDNRHTFTVSYDKGCAPCHTPADASARAGAVKDEIQLALFALRARLRNWAQQTFFDPDLWDYTALIKELGKEAPSQDQVPIQVKRARHNYYFVLRDASFGIHNAPYARHLLTIANRQLDAIGVPRIAPQVLSRLRRQEIQAVLRSDLQRLKAVDWRSW